MSKKIGMILAVWLLIPMTMVAQTYSALWKQVQAAQEKDLPKTAIAQLTKIETKARQERAYGQLIKATLTIVKLQGEIAPDSVAPAVRRLEKQCQGTRDVALQAVYATVLSKIFGDNRELEDNDAKHAYYRQQALAHPEVLGKTPANDYEPLVVKGKDSEVFGHDLLSVIGMELDAWQWMTDYYEKTGNCPAACLTAANTRNTIEGIDSLIAVYGDYAEAGELAIRRYDLMLAKGHSAQEKYQWLQESIRRWSHWKRVNELKNELAEFIHPWFAVEVPLTCVEPQKPQMVKFDVLRNVQQLTMRVYRTTLQGDTQLNPEVKNDLAQIKSKGLTEVSEAARTLTFAPHLEYEIFKDSVQLAALPAGIYLLSFSTNPQTETIYQLYYVSGIRLLQQAQPNKKMRYVVVNATTGQPVGGAQLRLGYERFRKNAMAPVTLTCDQQGEVIFDASKQQPSTAFAYTATDTSFPEYNNYGSYSYQERSYNQQRVSLFTDRSIYRPGQTLYATAIVWKEVSATEQVAAADKTMKIELRDANYKLVAEQQVATDRYGKCSAIFTLPTGKLNGRFTLRTSNASTTIRVEEYKRPAFQVNFDEYKESYQAGDTVHAIAKALSYAGVPIQEAKVHYTVKRRVAFWWMTYSRYWQGGYFGDGLKELVLNEGDATTADDGSFCVDMPMTMPDDMGLHTMFYHFVVEADVTDSAGETHHATMLLPLGNKPTSLTCDLPGQIRSDKLPLVTFNRRNAAGKEITGKMKYRIDGGKWLQTSANVPTALPVMKSGKHTIWAVCQNDTVHHDFVVFSLDDKRPATETHDWFYVSHEEFPADGSPVTLQVGSSDPDLHIVYSFFSGKNIIEQGVIKKNAALLNRQLTYKEEYGNGLLVTFAWVKNGQCYGHQQVIRRPMPDKQMKMQWETFRDRLTPGQQEEWRLTICKPDGTPADASLLAVLYDKSLDAIYPHKWSFVPKTYLSQPSAHWNWRAWGGYRQFGGKTMKMLEVPDLSYSTIDPDVFPYIRAYGIRIRGTRTMLMSKSADMLESAPMAAQSNDVLYEVVANDAKGGEVLKAKEEITVAGYGVKSQDADGAEEQQVQVRENLNETAFCYPVLKTDSDGHVTLSFILPESLTTWRFMGVANTVDMMYGYIDSEIIAQKDVMIQPNMPRFIREGDKAQISARLFNTTDNNVSGTSLLQLMDPVTDKVVFEQQQPFTIGASGSTSVTFVVNGLPIDTSLLICKVTAKGDGFSDGEQHYLPILSNKEYVTKTVPVTQHEAGTKTIDLAKLFPQGTDQQKLTIEYTNNPAWLMVQALPNLGQPHEYSAIDQAASYYSNLLAQHLINQAPQTKRIFEQWKQESQDAVSPRSSTLSSELEKNEDLKDLILAETPWVVAADKENEQRQRLADFFDANTITNRLQTAVDKLAALQNADGSFSWYPGMEGSTYITVAVEEMLARLQSLGCKWPTEAPSALYDKAFNFMAKEMVEQVSKMKKEEKKGYRQTFPSFTALRWLYLCAIDGRILKTDVKAANEYLIKLLKKDIKRQTIYEKAMTAVVLAKHGEKAKAAEYVKSLKEYTVYTEEMGRYYDTHRASYSWYDYKIPTEVAAIEAIQLVAPQDKQTVDEMRRWLLQEKRTQSWDTPINSVNAIYAFLNGNSHALTTSQPTTSLVVDGTPISTTEKTAGLGYVKVAQSYHGERTFTATKTSEGTSWGAVYAQFLQKTSDIELSESGITVKREVTIAGKPLSDGNILEVGQRISVRITIETTRDLDFVQVVDRRAACMEPVNQLSGYHNGAYCSPKDHATHYFYRGLSKGKHVIETTYYIDRAGIYETGTCTVGCAYAPAFRASAPSIKVIVKNKE